MSERWREDNPNQQEDDIWVRNSETPPRSFGEVGPGDFVQVGGRWCKIESKSFSGTITTDDGRVHRILHIKAYAKAEDMTKEAY